MIRLAGLPPGGGGCICGFSYIWRILLVFSVPVVPSPSDASTDSEIAGRTPSEKWINRGEQKRRQGGLSSRARTQIYKEILVVRMSPRRCLKDSPSRYMPRNQLKENTRRFTDLAAWSSVFPIVGSVSWCVFSPSMPRHFSSKHLWASLMHFPVVAFPVGGAISRTWIYPTFKK